LPFLVGDAWPRQGICKGIHLPCGGAADSGERQLVANSTHRRLAVVRNRRDYPDAERPLDLCFPIRVPTRVPVDDECHPFARQSKRLLQVSKAVAGIPETGEIGHRDDENLIGTSGNRVGGF
jgi:hypothetical protein